MFWKSVVGKLWITILFLVCFILAFLTILLTGYFETYYTKLAERDVEEQAVYIANLINANPDSELPYYVAENTSRDMAVSIMRADEEIWYSSESKKEQISFPNLLDDQDFSKAIANGETVIKVVNSESEILHQANDYQSVIIAVPLVDGGIVTVSYSLHQANITSEKMTNFIFVAAIFAVILTTIFAFFLSTRITAPLRRMKEISYQVAQGNFEERAPILSNDEIGELAGAFNQMGRHLQTNMTALTEEKEQLYSILSSMADGVVTMNEQGDIVMTNPPAERLLALWYAEEEVNANEDSQLPNGLLELFRKVVEEETKQVMDVDLDKGNWVIVMTPLYTQTKIRGAVAVLRDMTEERLLDKMRKDFIANVSHELRTPMVMLQGYSEAILDDIASTEEEKKELVQIIYDESLRMGRLVNELLDLARMESGKVQLNLEEVHIHEFVEKIIRKFQGIAKEKNIALEAHFHNIIYSHVFDLDRVEQVLTNLIDNAMRHTDEGGSVKLSIEKLENGLEIQVIDTGSGIQKGDLPFVFERFYKADKARTRGSSGTGLGLAIARNIVRVHGGEMKVSSVYGEGTTFTIYLPHRNL